MTNFEWITKDVDTLTVFCVTKCGVIAIFAPSRKGAKSTVTLRNGTTV